MRRMRGFGKRGIGRTRRARRPAARPERARRAHPRGHATDSARRGARPRQHAARADKPVATASHAADCRTRLADSARISKSLLMKSLGKYEPCRTHIAGMRSVASRLLCADAVARSPASQRSAVADRPGGGQTYSLTLQVLLLMTALTLLPAILLMMTSFTRIVIVLGILRQALGAGPDAAEPGAHRPVAVPHAVRHGAGHRPGEHRSGEALHGRHHGYRPRR